MSDEIKDVIPSQGEETTTVETAPDMTEDELLNYLGQNGADASDDSSKKDGDDDDDQQQSALSFESDDDDKDDSKDDEKKKEDADSGTDDDKGKGDVEDREFNNIVDYLNDTHKLELNLSNLPADLSREQEAEVVSDLFKRTLDGVNRQLSQYQQVEETLKDKEVADFIAAKAEGKSLRDFALEYAKTVDGQSDEDVVANDLTTRYPEMTKDQIEDMVSTYKEKGTLETMANSARENQKKAAEAEQEKEAQRADVEYQQGVQEFGKMVKNAGKVYNVPLTDQIKNDVFVAVTQRDQEGTTYLDKALQTDEGLFLAALGVLHMETLMKAHASTNTNRTNKKLVDRLFEKASDLQSDSQDDSKQEGFNAELADRF